MFAVLAIGIGLGSFVLTVFSPQRRIIIFLLGGSLVALAGIVTAQYDGQEMWQAVNVPVLVLILGLQLFSELLVRTGFLRWLSSLITDYYDRPVPVQIVLLVLTYFLSMWINNLAAIIVIVPLVLRLGGTFRFDMKRFLSALIIASNLGGASTIIGDFPNILIRSQMDATILQFMMYLGAPILLLTAVGFAIFYRLHLRRLAKISSQPNGILATRYMKRISYLRREQVRWKFVFLWLVSFALFLGSIWKFPDVNSAIVVTSLAAILLLIMRLTDTDVKSVDLSVLMFFGAVFVIVGGLEASGLFRTIGEAFLKVTDKPILVALFMQWIACAVTALFSAGPSTASLVALASQLEGIVPGYAIWWSLSLGVLAGSSGTLIGATAGPVMASLYEQEQNDTFTLGDYSWIGLPAMFLFLALGSGYIILLAILQSW